MNELETLCYIQEQTSFAEDYNDFGYQVFDDGRAFYVIFDAILQSFGDLNRNGRSYDADNIWSCIINDEFIQHCLRTNHWIGECDHPSPDKQGEELTLGRISNPDMGENSHLIRKPMLTPDKKFLKATIQSEPATEKGVTLAKKVVYDKIIPCFSARVLGALQNKNGRPTVNVRKLITYDWVLYPSHRQALAELRQPIIESVQMMQRIAGARIILLNELAKMAANNDRQVQWLCESFDISEKDLLGVTETGNSVVVAENGNIYVQPISDKNIRNKTRNMVQDWINK